MGKSPSEQIDEKLLIGSSIIGDINFAKLVNTDVKYIGGSKVKTD